MSDTPTSDSNPTEPPLAPSSTAVEGELPPLMADRAFWGMGATQFLGAFNDNLFKQLLLLLATPIGPEAATKDDQQGLATIVFGAAFLIFSGFAGWLADRTPKRKLIVASKLAEIVVMTMGLIAFLLYDTLGLAGLFVVLFFMGMQSAFFGPPKYGILPEMLRDSDLPRANGVFLMFTFIAIIFGTVLAQPFSTNPTGAWRGSLVCIGIAVVGTLTALFVRRTPAAEPGSKLRWSDVLVPPEMFALLRRERDLAKALLVTSAFWLLGALVIQVVNALGKTQFGFGEDDNLKMSALTATTGIGIPIGCVVGGLLCRNRINPRVVTAGAIGATACLALLAITGPQQGQLLGYAGSLPVLLLLGFFTGMFVVPIQVSIQVLPPPGDKGRMIALVNQCNFVGIIASGFVYTALSDFLNSRGLPSCLGFAVGAAIMLPIALFYRPKEVRLAE
ncbi:MAG: MFS transporter [Planctomycetota bacterium]